MPSLINNSFVQLQNWYLYQCVTVNPHFSAADARAVPGTDMSISDGSSEISGVPKDREKKHDISNH